MPPVKEGEGVVVENAETVRTPEQIAAEEKEANAAFAAGVAKTAETVKTGESPEETPEAKQARETAEADAAAKATAEATAKAEAAKTSAAAAAQPAAGSVDVAALVREELKKAGVTDVRKEISTLSGHIGAFKQQLEKATATATAAASASGKAAPTPLEIQEALGDLDKWTQLQEDFPEWMKPVAAELTRLRKDMKAVAARAQEHQPAAAAAPAAVVQPIDTNAILNEAEERAYVRMKHPGWKATCATPEFSSWLEKTAAPEIKAKSSSESGDDAVAVFDAYEAHKQKLAEEVAKKAKADARLKAAVPATGSAEPPAAGISDEAAFERGVKATLRKTG